jgi:hypothetical protein
MAETFVNMAQLMRKLATKKAPAGSGRSFKIVVLSIYD